MNLPIGSTLESIAVPPLGVNQSPPSVRDGDPSHMPRYGSDDYWRVMYRNNLFQIAMEEDAKFQQERIQQSFPKSNRGRMIDLLPDSILPSGFGFRRLLNPDKIPPSTYRRMTHDSQVAAVLKTIINATIARGHKIVGGRPDINQFITRMYQRLPMFRTFQQVLSGFYYGHSATEKVFDQLDNGQWFIRKHKVLPPQTINYDVRENGEIKAIYQDGRFIGINRLIRFQPEKINIFTYDGGLNDQFGNPYGVSALKPVFYDWKAKRRVLREQQRHLQLMAGGFIVGFAGPGNSEVMLEQLVNLRSGAAAVVPLDQKIEVHKPVTAGSAFLEGVTYFNQQIAKGMLVAPQLIEASQKFGSRALGDVNIDLFKDTRIQPLQNQLMEWADAEIRQIVNANFGRQEVYPRFMFRVWSRRELNVIANEISKLIQVGVLRQNDFPEIRQEIEWSAISFEEAGEAIPPQSGATQGRSDRDEREDEDNRTDPDRRTTNLEQMNGAIMNLHHSLDLTTNLIGTLNHRIRELEAAVNG